MTVPTHIGLAERNGIRIRRVVRTERTEHLAIPVTPPGHTLTDIKPLLTPYAFRKATEQAEILRLDTGRREHDADARTRPEHLTRAGYRVLRFSWRQIHERPREVAAALRAAGLPASG